MTRFVRMILIVCAVFMFFCVTNTASAYETTFKDITLIEDGEMQRIRTSAETVADFYNERGISLNMGDKSSHNPKDILTQGMQIKINRGFFITANIDGKAERIKVSHDTAVGNLISRLERERSVTYMYEGPLITSLQPNDEIILTTEREATFVINEVIPFETETIETEELEVGVEEIVQEGSFGEKQITVNALFQSGNEASREVLDEKVTREPVNRIIHVGTGLVAQTPHGDKSYTRELAMVATAYHAGFESTGKNPGDYGYGVTASGVKCRPGIVAVDPSVIPLGSRLYVEGYGEALAADTGSAINGNRIDLYYENYSDALAYGKRNIMVYVLD